MDDVREVSGARSADLDWKEVLAVLAGRWLPGPWSGCDGPGGCGQGPRHHCIYGVGPGDRGTQREVGGLVQGHRRSSWWSWMGTQVPF